MTRDEFRRILERAPATVREPVEIALACGNFGLAIDIVSAGVRAAVDDYSAQLRLAERWDDEERAAELRDKISAGLRALERMNQVRAGLAPKQESKPS